MTQSTEINNPDVILIGSGIMSSTLGAMLRQLNPAMRIQVYEITSLRCQESSHGWHNAGTGHAGLCELSYTPDRHADGTVNVTKALEVFAQFERSKQFWAYAVKSGMAPQVGEFVRPVPHVSFVQGQEQVEFLRSRHQGLSRHPLFSSMVFTSNPATIAEWTPLLVEGRDPGVPIAATRVNRGTDVDFGALARQFLHWLSIQSECGVATFRRVVNIERQGEKWEVITKDSVTGRVSRNRARFVFVGAGGGSLLLLQKAGIPEAKGLGGFPIGGQWLVCDNPQIVSRHQAKVYGQALGAAPTMAVPHLDTRILEGRRTMLFGPFAAWTTKFLHEKGSHWDLLQSIKPDNIGSLLKTGIHNLPLVRYLIQQGTQSMADRMNALRHFHPAAREDDWRLVDAGIRVQTIKKTNGETGIVHYGTEVITSADLSMAALLGASPGASVSVDIILSVIKTCFPEMIGSPFCQARLTEMIPTWNQDITVPSIANRYCEMTMPSVEQTLQMQ